MQTQELMTPSSTRTLRHHNLVLQQTDIVVVLREYTQSLAAEQNSLPSDIRCMMRYIHLHLFRPSLSAGEIKLTCKSRNNNIATQFRQATGVGIWEYVVQCRLGAAAYVLSRMRVNMYNLAAAVGYTEETFSRAFKNAFGSSPRLYHVKHFQSRLPEIDDQTSQEGGGT